LQLAGNPFADMFGGSQPAAAPPTLVQNNMWMTNGNGKYRNFVEFYFTFFSFILHILSVIVVYRQILV
jgi:hypothetical protein